MDTHGDESIVLTSKVKDFSDISKVFTDFTTEFSLPASKQNNKVFHNYWQSDVVGSSVLGLGITDFRLKQRCSISINGILFKEGYVKLNSISMINGKPKDYKCVFFGRLTKFSDVFGDNLVSELDWTDLNHDIRSISSVNSGLNSTTSLLGDKIIYPLINASEVEWTATRLASGSDIAADKFSPAIQVKEIINKIQEKYGVTFNSNLFDELQFSKQYMWLPQRLTEEQLALSNGGPTQIIFDNVTDHGAPNYSPVHTPSSSLDTSRFQYDWSEFRVRVTITPATGYTTVPYRVMLKYSDERYGPSFPIYNQDKSGVGTTTQTFLLPNYYSRDNEFLKLYVESQDQAAPFIASYSIQDTYVKAYGIEYPLFEADDDGNDSIVYDDISKQLSHTFLKLKVIDFIKNLIKLHNMVIVPVNETEFNFYTYDEWLALGNMVDLSEYVNISDHNIKVVNLPKTIAFEYKDPKAEVGKKFKELFHEAYGNEHRSTKGYGEEYKVDVTDYENLLWDRLDSSNEYFVGKSYEADAIDGAFTPIEDSIYLMYWGRNASATINLTNVSSFSGYKMCDSYYPSVTPTHSLNFGGENSAYTTIPGGSANLIEQHYGNMLSVMMDQQSREYEFKVIIPPLVFQGLQPNDTIKIGDKYFTIQEFSINMLSNEMSITLINTARSISVIPPADTTAPVIGTLSITGKGIDTISISWTDATDAVGVTDYWIYRDSVKVGSTDGDTNVFTDTGLASDTLYGYKVLAKDEAGNTSDFSNTETERTESNTLATINISKYSNSNGFDACMDSDRINRYTDGIPDLPAPGDRVYMDEYGQTPFVGDGDYYAHSIAQSWIRINSLGVIISAGPCL